MTQTTTIVIVLVVYHFRNGTDTADLAPTKENIERKISLLENFQRAQEDEAEFAQHRSSFDTFKSSAPIRKGGIFASSRRGSLGRSSESHKNSVQYQIPVFGGVNDLMVPGGVSGAHGGRRAAVSQRPSQLVRNDSRGFESTDFTVRSKILDRRRNLVIFGQKNRNFQNCPIERARRTFLNVL